jgi:acyl-CoA reductase-like NAD-dependent aldehyde dehydrogenase
MFIDGEWVTAASGAVMDVRDPSTGKVIANVPSADQTDARRAVDAAKNAFEAGIWSKISPGTEPMLCLESQPCWSKT